MYNYFLLTLSEMKFFFGLFFAVSFPLGIFFLWKLIRRKPTIARYGVLGLFYGRKRAELVYLFSSYSYCIYVISCVLSSREMNVVHLTALSVLLLVRIFCMFQPADALTTLLNGVLAVGALLACSMLADFMSQTSADGWVVAMYVLMDLLVINYHIYFFIKDVGRL